MYAIEFETDLKGGVLTVPDDDRSLNNQHVRSSRAVLGFLVIIAGLPGGVADGDQVQVFSPLAS